IAVIRRPNECRRSYLTLRCRPWMRRVVQARRQRRKASQVIYQIPPCLAVRRCHQIPALSVFQKIPSLFRAEAGEFPERTNALSPLDGSKVSKCKERFLDLSPLSVRQSLQGLSFFLRGQVEELSHLAEDGSALFIGQVLPPANSLFECVSLGGRHDFRFFLLARRADGVFEQVADESLVLKEIL